MKLDDIKRLIDIIKNKRLGGLEKSESPILFVIAEN